MVAISRIDGNELNSRGFSMNSTVIKIRTENVKDSAKDISNIQVGIGRIRTTKMATTPRARPISPLNRERTPNLPPDAMLSSAIKNPFFFRRISNSELLYQISDDTEI